MKYNSTSYIEFNNIIYDIAKNPTVLEMKNFKQHYNCSCYDHCMKVSYYSFLISKKLHLDYVSAARAAMLHDLFLYDWRVKENDRKGFHAFRHPYIAYRNASKMFSLNKKEKDIIIKHMWPVTIIPPKYIESYIITLTDKFSALKEAFDYYSEKATAKRFVRFASFLLLLLFVHIP